MRVLLTAVLWCAIVAVASTVMPTSVQAQTPTGYLACRLDEGGRSTRRIIFNVIEIYADSPSVEKEIRKHAETLVHSVGGEGWYPLCDRRASRDHAETVRRSQMSREGMQIEISSWVPPRSSSPVDSKRLTLEFRPTREGSTAGYQWATIDLHYRFLRCAGEVQVAYSLDRKSLKHSEIYHIPSTQGAVARSIRPATPPSVPTTIALGASVRGEAQRLVARLDDAIAGEALGMDCFSGQTRKIGTVAELVGAQATPAQVKTYLATLYLDRPAPMQATLRNARAVAPSAEDAAREAQIKLDQSRDAAMRSLSDFGRQTIADRKAREAKAAKEQADYQRALQASSAAQAKYQKERAAADAAAAKYRAERAAYEAAERAAGRTPR